MSRPIAPLLAFEHVVPVRVAQLVLGAPGLLQESGEPLGLRLVFAVVRQVVRMG